MSVNNEKEKRTLIVYIVIFILLAGGISISGYLSYHNFKQQFRAQAGRQLSSIAELKVKNLVNWRKERLADAQKLSVNPSFALLVQTYFENPDDSSAQVQIENWLKSYKTYSEYDQVRLLDVQGLTRLSEPAGLPSVLPAVAEGIREVLQSKQMTMVDFYRKDVDRQIRLSLLTPILDPQTGSQVVGFVTISIDPQKYLYPYLKEWPIDSTSAETLLVRRDENDALFLDELRFDPNAALTLRVPLTDTEIPAVKAVLGQSGVVQGLDYHGEHVLADVRAVPDSPWFLVSKMDIAEVDAPLTTRSWQTVLLVGMSIFMTGAGLMTSWRQQRIQFYRAQAEAAEALRESEKKYRSLIENMQVGMVVHAPDTRILLSNPMASQLLGLTSDQMQGKTANDPAWSFIREDGTCCPLEEYPVNRALASEAPISNLVLGILRLDREVPTWVQCDARQERDSNGFLQQIVVTFFDITDRKRVEDALNESERQLKESQAIAGVGSYVLNFSIGTWSSSDVLDAIFGIDKNFERSIAGWSDLIHPADREHMTDYFSNEVVDKHMRFDKEYRIVRKNDGVDRWVYGLGQLEFDAQNQLVRMLGTIQDITERKQAEEAQYESERRFRDMLSTVNMAAVMLDVKGNITFCNNFVLELTGWQMTEVFEKNWFEVFLPDDVSAQVASVFSAGIQMGGLPTQYENEIVTRQGEHRLITWNNTVLYSDDGLVIGTASLGIDITESQKMEIALRLREEQYRTLVEQLPSIIYVDDVNLEGRTLYISPQIETILGFTPQEWMDGSPGLWAQQVHSDDLEWVHGEYMRCLQDGKPLDCEYRIRSSDGRLLWFRDQAALLRDENGRPHLIQGMIYDISGHKQVEQTIHQRVLELELLYESGLAFIQLLHPKEIAQKVIDLLEQKMDWHHTAIRLYDRETDTLQLVAFNQPGLNSAEEITTARELVKTRLTRPDQGLSGWAFQHGQIVRVVDLVNDQRYFETVPGMQSGLYVPIKLGDHVIGVISIESEQSNAFSDADERLTNTLTNQAANALENARLFDETGRRGREFASLYETSKVLSAVYDLDTLLKIIVDRTKEMLNSSTSGMYLYHSEIQELELTVGTSYTTPIGLRLGLGEGMAGQVGQTGQPMRIDDYSTWEGRSKKFGDHLIRAVIEVPMLYAGELIGVLTADETGASNRKFTDADERLLSLFATQAAGAINAARHHAETIRYADELEQRVIERTAEIEATRQRLELAANAGGIGVWEIYIKDNKIFWDMRMHAIHGTDPAKFDNSPEAWWQLVHPDDLERSRKQFMNAVQNTGGFSDEYRIVHSNGSLRDVSTNGVVLYDQEHAPERMIGVNIDITERKQVTEALQHANSEMESAMRAKDEFLATMSHELRTPLNSILGISESLEEQIVGTLNPKQLRYIGIVKESGRHLLELINDILDISKIEAGRMELELQNISVDKLCQSSLRMVRELAQKKSLKVSFEMINQVDVIFGDERRLKQSLVNLFSNAVKFTPAGSHIGLEVCGHPQENEVTFTIWDKGVGIAEQDVKLLFQPFVQLDAGLAREYQGTGLGLALVSQIMRLHGGSVSLESKIGEGSRFTITLPWLPEQQNTQFKSMVTSHHPVKKTETKHTGSILLVEDTDVIISLMTDYLQYKGYRVLSAHNGMEGLMLAKQERPDLIIMDVMMPVMDGFEATKNIREVDKNTPIIALTALAMPGDRERCLAAGMNDYLSKPIRIQELADMIEKYLTAKGQIPDEQ